MKLPAVKPISDYMWKKMSYRCRTIRIVSDQQQIMHSNSKKSNLDSQTPKKLNPISKMASSIIMELESESSSIHNSMILEKPNISAHQQQQKMEVSQYLGLQKKSSERHGQHYLFNNIMFKQDLSLKQKACLHKQQKVKRSKQNDLKELTNRCD